MRFQKLRPSRSSLLPLPPLPSIGDLKRGWLDVSSVVLYLSLIFLVGLRKPWRKCKHGRSSYSSGIPRRAVLLHSSPKAFLRCYCTRAQQGLSQKESGYGRPCKLEWNLDSWQLAFFFPRWKHKHCSFLVCVCVWGALISDGDAVWIGPARIFRNSFLS